MAHRVAFRFFVLLADCPIVLIISPNQLLLLARAQNHSQIC